MNGKMSDIFSKFRRKSKQQDSPTNRKQDQYEDWPSTASAGGLLISGDFLPMIHKFEDLFENSSAMMHFMTFLDSLGQQHLLKFYIHVEGFKSATNYKELKTDASHIFDNYISTKSHFNLDLPEDIQTNVEQTLASEADLLDKLDCFDEAQNFIMNKLKNRYFNDFLSSPYYCLHKVEVYKIGSVQLIDILQDHQLLRLFADFMEQEGRLNLLEFIIEVESFNQATTSNDSSFIVENAVQIYNRYFQIDASNSLNFDSAIRNEIEESICSKNGTPSIDTFEKAKDAANAILETRFIPLFVKSKPFLDHISILSSSIDVKLDKSVFIPKSKTRESISSLQSQSIQSEDVTEFSNDKNSSIMDDDRLSQCSSAYSSEVSRKTGSSLGRIDLLGRYESLFDTSLCSPTDLQSNRSSSLKNMLNRYVKHPVVQEDEQSYAAAMQIVENVKRMVNRSQSNGSNFTIR